jgi:hypothetical protein
MAVLAGVVLLAAAWYVRASDDGLPTSVPSCAARKYDSVR